VGVVEEEEGPVVEEEVVFPMIEVTLKILLIEEGQIQIMRKFHKVKLSILHIIGKYDKEIGGKSGKLSTKSGNFHTVIIDMHPPL